MSWVEVEQHSRRAAKRARPPVVRVSLTARNGMSTLWVTLPNDIASQAGWEIGSTVGLALGEGKFEGWVKLCGQREGRKIKRPGRGTNTATVMLAAPAAWNGLVCPSTIVETFRTRPNELLIQIPWDFSEVQIAEQEAA